MIKIDIEMPKCCDECFALDDHGDYPMCRINGHSRGYNFDILKKRMPDCPMKEHSDWNEMLVICDNCGHAITVKKETQDES